MYSPLIRGCTTVPNRYEHFHPIIIANASMMRNTFNGSSISKLHSNDKHQFGYITMGIREKRNENKKGDTNKKTTHANGED